MTTPNGRFPLRFHSEELYNEMKAEAEKEMRSLNTLINIACKEHLKRIKEDEKNKK